MGHDKPSSVSMASGMASNLRRVRRRPDEIVLSRGGDEDIAAASIRHTTDNLQGTCVPLGNPYGNRLGIHSSLRSNNWYRFVFPCPGAAFDTRHVYSNSMALPCQNYDIRGSVFRCLFQHDTVNLLNSSCSGAYIFNKTHGQSMKSSNLPIFTQSFFSI